MSPVADSRWRVLPLGRAATLRRAAGEGLLFALVGLAGLFVAAVLSAVIIGEVFPETAVETTIDLVVRASLVGILVLGALGLLVLGLLDSLHGPLCARALAAARLRGTPATSVPIPTQWKAAQENSAGRYKRIAIMLLAILGISYLILVASMLGSGLDAVDLGILVGGGLLLALIWAGIPLTGKMLPGGRRDSRSSFPSTGPRRIGSSPLGASSPKRTSPPRAPLQRSPGPTPATGCGPSAVLWQRSSQSPP
ncbi:hypothetical protein H3H54_16210 [Brachybacterium sp. Z12]|uniref:hypothetical protein n=1 Tax=Brachybacterium sp. Z12 TaxID=2759167 RepID=UPI001863091B|nr:hypothetical protein [Brachybacterium sp. Z12]QNN82478.1 hypothetical protein H3H54_16210 [Brachybacterium sp. Z12]